MKIIMKTKSVKKDPGREEQAVKPGTSLSKKNPHRNIQVSFRWR